MHFSYCGRYRLSLKEHDNWSDEHDDEHDDGSCKLLSLSFAGVATVGPWLLAHQNLLKQKLNRSHTVASPPSRMLVGRFEEMLVSDISRHAEYTLGIWQELLRSPSL